MTLVELRQIVESLMNCQYIQIPLTADEVLMERDSGGRAAALLTSGCNGVIHENPPHRDGSDSQHVTAILPIDLPLID